MKAVIGQNGVITIDHQQNTRITLQNGETKIEKKTHLQTQLTLSQKEMTKLGVEPGGEIEVILPQKTI